jgi:hypothetical protein
MYDPDSKSWLPITGSHTGQGSDRAESNAHS